MHAGRAQASTGRQKPSRRSVCSSLLLGIVGAGLLGCAADSRITSTAVVAPRTLKAPTEVHESVRPYLREFLKELETAGFTVGEPVRQDALTFSLDFSPNPFAMTVKATLRQGNLVIVTAETTNYGAGTVLARTVAINDLARTTLAQFGDQLNQVKPRLTIVED